MIQHLDDLFLHTLKDVLYAQRKILNVLPKMELQAKDPLLRAAFATHRDETEGQLTRLESVFADPGKTARGARCDAMVGLIDEVENLMIEINDPETMDAALIVLAQAVEHHEIARHGTLIAWASHHGHTSAAGLLKATLAEEHSADRALSKLAQHHLNAAAAAEP